MKTKAQMNWEVGRELQEVFLKELSVVFDEQKIEMIKDIFKQVRQNEYRRGKEDGFKEAKEEYLYDI